MGAVAFLAALGLALVPAGSAWGATVIDGPIDLGTAGSFGVLGASAVTNTGPSVIDGDVGVSPDAAITGFPPGTISAGSTFHTADAVATDAQHDLDVAMMTAASLSPTVSGLGNLTGMSLVPGVYAGGALSLDGAGVLTLAGSADSVWVFTASSTLTTGSMSRIVLTGGASACNVFWRVASSATFGTDTDFAGTVMAEQSITATTGTTVAGRLLAAAGAVTLDSTNVTVPTGCAAPGIVTTTDSPVITSGAPPQGTAGTAYTHTVTSTGVPAASYTVTSGTLPSGLSLDAASGVISGTPVAAGTSTFTITASNGTAPDASAVTTIVVVAAAVVPAAPAAPILPPTGADPAPHLVTAAVLALAGAGFLGLRRPRKAGSAGLLAGRQRKALG